MTCRREHSSDEGEMDSFREDSSFQWFWFLTPPVMPILNGFVQPKDMVSEEL